MTKRAYRGTVQAEIAALTRQRILEATLALYEAHWLDQVTLQHIAERAGVTVQTLLRHFGSREGLETALSVEVSKEVVSERDEVKAGDLTGVADHLVRHYEGIGDRLIRLLAQEDRYPPLKNIMQNGRNKHRDWVGRVFAPHLPTRQDRERLVPQLVAVCDVYVWKLLRRDMDMSVEAYRSALEDMIRAVIGREGGPP